MKLVIDCFGGDKGCAPCIEAAKKALAVYPDLRVILVGDEEKIRAELSEVPEGIEILHAPDIVTGNDKPTDAIRLKRESSMMKAIKLLREDESVDGLISKDLMPDFLHPRVEGYRIWAETALPYFKSACGK